MMKLTILDGKQVNPGDLSWKPLEELGDLTFYPNTTAEQLIERARDSDALFPNKIAFSRAVFQQLPKLKYIGVMATGYDRIDLEAAREYGVTVTNVAGYGTMAVAQHTIALLLEITNGAYGHSSSVHQGEWDQEKGWCYWNNPIIELDGMTLGIIGMGSIGQQVAKIASALGMRILYYSRSNKPEAMGKRVELETLFGNSDVISLHCPATPETEGIINRKSLAMIKDGAYLLNTSRGALIDEQALADALKEGKMSAAGLDVLVHEPPLQGSPLIGLPNCLITPHQAWASKASRRRLIEEVSLNLKAFLQGKRRNVVS